MKPDPMKNYRDFESPGLLYSGALFFGYLWTRQWLHSKSFFGIWIKGVSNVGRELFNRSILALIKTVLFQSAVLSSQSRFFSTFLPVYILRCSCG